MNRECWVAAITIVALTCACFCAPHANAHKRKNPSGIRKDAVALFERGTALADMMAFGTPPYALRIQVAGMGQLSADSGGIYSLQFASPSEFRQDAAFGGSYFSAGTHGDAQNQWRIDSDSAPELLEEVFLRSITYAYAPTALELTDVSATVSHRDENGVNLDCVEQRNRQSKQACFDASTGALRAVLDDPGFVYQFDDFHQWGTHLAPAKILVFADNALVLRATVEFLVPLSNDQARASNFSPPLDARYSQSGGPCTIRQPRLVFSAIPSFPRAAGSPSGKGSVLFWGVIDRAGQIEDAIVMQSAGAAYDQAAFRAMKQWRYEPATLCGEPVAMPGAFRVAFR